MAECDPLPLSLPVCPWPVTPPSPEVPVGLTGHRALGRPQRLNGWGATPRNLFLPPSGGEPPRGDCDHPVEANRASGPQLHSQEALSASGFFPQCKRFISSSSSQAKSMNFCNALEGAARNGAVVSAGEGALASGTALQRGRLLGPKLPHHPGQEARRARPPGAPRKGLRSPSGTSGSQTHTQPHARLSDTAAETPGFAEWKEQPQLCLLAKPLLSPAPITMTTCPGQLRGTRESPEQWAAGRPPAPRVSRAGTSRAASRSVLPTRGQRRHGLSTPLRVRSLVARHPCSSREAAESVGGARKPQSATL